MRDTRARIAASILHGEITGLGIRSGSVSPALYGELPTVFCFCLSSVDCHHTNPCRYRKGAGRRAGEHLDHVCRGVELTLTLITAVTKALKKPR